MLDLAQHYRSFEDRPWNMWSMYRRLDERFPDSLFILTIRDAESWWRSTEHWITVSKPDVFPRYQLHLRVPQANKESMIESYLRYNAEVEAYFRNTSKLLIMNIEKGDGWDKLCAFLGTPKPQAKFPHQNRQSYKPGDENQLRTKRRLKHGVECQDCRHVTALNKKSFDLIGESYGGNKPLSGTKLSRYVMRRTWNFKLHDVRKFKTIGKMIHSAHRALRILKQPQLHISVPRTRRQHNPGLAENEFAVVSCLFNPGGSNRRVQNFRKFLSGIKQSGVRCLVVELTLGSNPFQITDHEDVIRLRTDCILWHKERLLNTGIQRLLSEGVRKIAWLDGDIVFEDSRWPVEIVRRLETTNLCQVFETVGVHVHKNGPPLLAPSAVKYFRKYGQLFPQPVQKFGYLAKGLLLGGQSGFGWAARSEVLEKSLLFENAVVGGGDKLMFAASLVADLETARLDSLTHSNIACKACGHRNRSAAYTASYLEWAKQWSAAVRGEVDYARLHIRDMYHGQRTDKGYMKRHDILYQHEFNPATDVKMAVSNCLEWTGRKRQLQREVEAYFLSRREDV